MPSRNQYSDIFKFNTKLIFSLFESWTTNSALLTGGFPIRTGKTFLPQMMRECQNWWNGSTTGVEGMIGWIKLKSFSAHWRKMKSSIPTVWFRLEQMLLHNCSTYAFTAEWWSRDALITWILRYVLDYAYFILIKTDFLSEILTVPFSLSHCVKSNHIYR